MMWLVVVTAVVARLSLVLYGQWQDKTMAVKFTDVDYYVFNDAAAFVTEGKSPYERLTYRYTPLLAYLLTPNMLMPTFGKIVFVIFDVLTGIIIHCLLCSRGVCSKMATVCASLWLLNPLPMAVSARGNAESIMSFIVILTLLMLHQKKIVAAAICYALAVHFKIYPIVYSLPIYLLLGNTKDKGNAFPKSVKTFVAFMFPNKERLVFVSVTVSIVGALTGVFYKWYGWPFLYETYLYHITRRDVRHNFSPYFYMLYLTSGHTTVSSIVNFAAFLPQVLLLLVISFKFYRDPPFCWFLNTFAFVAVNKVCTSQYFLWYLCLLPLVVPRIKMSVFKAMFSTFLWFSAQGLWLLPAYYLEFEGVNTFVFIWLAGLWFFFTNIYIMYSLVKAYEPTNRPFCKPCIKDS